MDQAGAQCLTDHLRDSVFVRGLLSSRISRPWRRPMASAFNPGRRPVLPVGGGMVMAFRDQAVPLQRQLSGRAAKALLNLTRSSTRHYFDFPGILAAHLILLRTYS